MLSPYPAELLEPLDSQDQQALTSAISELSLEAELVLLALCICIRRESLGVRPPGRHKETVLACHGLHPSNEILWTAVQHLYRGVVILHGGRPLDWEEYGMARAELDRNQLVTTEEGSQGVLSLCNCMSDGIEEGMQSVKLDVGHFLVSFRQSHRDLIRAVFKEVPLMYFSESWSA